MHNGCHAWLLHENTKRVAHRLEDNHGLKKQVLASSPPEHDVVGSICFISTPFSQCLLLLFSFLHFAADY